MKEFLAGVRFGLLLICFMFLYFLVNAVKEMQEQQKEDSARIKSLNNNLYSLREELYNRP